MAGGQEDKSLPPEQLFQQAWADIEDQLAKLRHDLDLADRGGLADETRVVIIRKLAILQKTVDVFAERWMDFERRRKGLEERVARQG
jgi:hypothetical protein